MTEDFPDPKRTMPSVSLPPAKEEEPATDDEDANDKLATGDRRLEDDDLNRTTLDQAKQGLVHLALSSTQSCPVDDRLSPN